MPPRLEVKGFYESDVGILHFTASRLRARTGSSASSWGAESPPPAGIVQTIKGRATIATEDKLAVIGANVASPKSLDLWIRKFEESKRPTGPDSFPDDLDPKVRAYVERCRDDYAEKPRTAALYYLPPDLMRPPKMKDWTIDCSVHGDLFRALWDDIIADRCTELSVTIKLHPAWTDTPHQPGYPETLGILPSQNGIARSDGWTESVEWVNRVFPDGDEDAASSQPADGALPAAAITPQLINVQVQVATLATTIRRGFVVLGLLMGLVLLKWLLG